jgi:phosphopantothenoylcysteine synthetase/decarboxylase
MPGDQPPAVGLVGSSAGGVEHIRLRLVEPLLAQGYRVAVTLTPTAATWLDAVDEIEKIESVTGYVVRRGPRLPREASPHPEVDCYAVAPASANTVAKLALGIGDNQALTQVCEAIGGRAVPVVVFPRVNAAHAGHPAWSGHLAVLRTAGVRVVAGGGASTVGHELPWPAVLEAITTAAGGHPGPRSAARGPAG